MWLNMHKLSLTDDWTPPSEGRFYAFPSSWISRVLGLPWTVEHSRNHAMWLPKCRSQKNFSLRLAPSISKCSTLEASTMFMKPVTWKFPWRESRLSPIATPTGQPCWVGNLGGRFSRPNHTFRNCNLGWHFDHNLMRAESELPSQAILRFLIHRNNEW